MIDANAYSSTHPDALLAGFEAAGGWYDKEKFALRYLADFGLSAVALQDIPADCALSRIPTSAMLSPTTSELKDLLPAEAWSGLNSWAQLILVMMWEAAQGDKSPWCWYISSMPTRFDTPMFWSETEKLQLVGTEIEHRVGRAEAEALFTDTIKPLIQDRPDVFNHDPAYYTLDKFHIQGSRILSRSFDISKPQDDSSSDTSSTSDEDSGSEAIAMVPIADTLNATSHNNARLVNDDDAAGERPAYTMTSTENIPAGSQIFNTYMELPDSELLRKYGFVDAQPLSEDIAAKLARRDLLLGWQTGNPFDEVSLDGDRVLHFVTEERGVGKLQERVDWWLDEGQEDTFGVTLETGVDESFHAFARLLLDDTTWRSSKKKSRLPDPRPDKQTLRLLQQVIGDRLSRYQTTIHDDITAIQDETNSRLRAALTVRIGEKRALLLAQAECRSQVPREREEGGREKKRVKVS